GQDRRMIEVATLPQFVGSVLSGQVRDKVDGGLATFCILDAHECAYEEQALFRSWQRRGRRGSPRISVKRRGSYRRDVRIAKRAFVGVAWAHCTPRSATK